MLHAGLVASHMRASFRLIVWDLVKRHARSGTWKQLIACAARTDVFFFFAFFGEAKTICAILRNAQKSTCSADPYCFPHSKGVWLPPLPRAPGPRDRFKRYHDKKRLLSIFFFNSSQRVKPRRFIPFSIYFVLITENCNIGELQIQGNQGKLDPASLSLVARDVGQLRSETVHGCLPFEGGLRK